MISIIQGRGEREKGKFQDIFLPLTLKPGDLGKITSTSHNKTFNSQNHKFKRAIYSNICKRNKSLLAGSFVFFKHRQYKL